MRKSILCVFFVLLALLLFSSCTKSKVPDGMFLASEPESDGFTLYIPQGYVVDRSTGVLCGYVSKLDPTFVSCAVVTPEEETIPAYFTAHLPELETIVDEGTTLTIEGEDIVTAVGEKEGHAWIYSFTRGGVNYKVTQIFVPKGETLADGMAILTYTGKTDATVTGTVGYTDHYADFEKIVTNFSFDEITKTPEEALPDTEGAPDGTYLASNPAITHYRLYLPVAFRADMATGIVSGYAEDGAGVSAVSIYPEGFSTVQEYFAAQLEKLALYYDDVTRIGEDDPEVIKVGGSDAFRYEVSLRSRQNGKTVRISLVYILLRTGLHRGLYTLTFSALGDDPDAANASFALHANDFATVLEHFSFK